MANRKSKSLKLKRTRQNKRVNRKTRRYRGGALYGNGVGANCYDPNYSIYNTRELQLFPYRPAK